MVTPVQSPVHNSYTTAAHTGSGTPAHLSSHSTLQSMNSDDGCCGSGNSCASTTISIIFYPIYLVFYVVTWPFIKLYEFFFPPASTGTSSTGDAAGASATATPPEVVDVFSPEILAEAAKYEIDTDRLADVPMPIDWNQLRLDSRLIALNDSVNNDLIRQFDAVYGSPFQPVREGITEARRMEMRDALRDFVQFLLNRDTSFSRTGVAYFNDLTLLLKGVILRLQNPNPTTSPEDIKACFQDLVAASTECCPRRYEETLRLYKALNGRANTWEEFALLELQQLKESLLWEGVFTINPVDQHGRPTNDRFHLVDHARLTIGAKWGLDATNPNLATDAFIRDGSMYIRETDPDHPGQTRQIAPAKYEQILQARFTTAAAIHYIHRRQAEDGNAALASLCLAGITLPDDIDFETLFQADGRTPTPQLIGMLLEHLGFIKLITT